MDERIFNIRSNDRKGRRWSREDDATLRRLAGKVEPAQIAGTLHRTPEAVRKRAAKLHLDITCHAPTLMRCPRCGQWRPRLYMGICGVCIRTETRDQLIERERLLTYEVDPTYRKNASDRRREARRTEYEDRSLDPVELERVLCERLDRENARLRRRCERMEEALRTGYGENM